jgi:hypothetical protein
MSEPVEPIESIDPQPPQDSILKPRQRRAPNFTPEQRAAMSERMRKVNEARIANSKAAETQKIREEKQAQKEAKKKELEAEIERLKLEAAKAPKLAPPPKKKYPRKVKEEEFDSDGYDDLLAKTREVKRYPSPEPESVAAPPPVATPKRRATPAQSPAAPVAPRIVVKFL